MSLSAAINNAVSGLAATSKAADVIASNISNALTEGYGVRSVVLSSRADAGGVTVEAISRYSNPVLLADRREAEAEVSNQNVLNAFFESAQGSLGLPTETGSAQSLFTQFESSLITATQAPESTASLAAVLESLKSFVKKVNDISEDIQTERQKADGNIAKAVGQLNAALQTIDKLNDSIVKQVVLGNDVSSLIDQRQVAIDRVNKIVPVREINKDNGRVELLAGGGVFLLDDSVHELSFSKTNIITPELNIESGTLNGLYLDGKSYDVSSSGKMSGGTLQSYFEVRDELAPRVQSLLDGLSVDLIERLEGNSVDPTLALGSPGLLTDGGDPLDLSSQVGLAARISVNSLVDPDEGGQLWRLRDGLGALSSGPEGSTEIILAIKTAIEEIKSQDSDAFTEGAWSSAGLLSDVVSEVGARREHISLIIASAAARVSSLNGLEAEDGVDTDFEMQGMLDMENSYSANAKVLMAIEKMLDALMEI